MPDRDHNNIFEAVKIRLATERTMRKSLQKRILRICEEKIAKNGEGVGLSFYAFFSNKNSDPELLMEAAVWWIMTHRLDHFEKATRIRQMIRAEI